MGNVAFVLPVDPQRTSVRRQLLDIEQLEAVMQEDPADGRE